MIRAMVETRPAGFWIRALAAALDVAIFLLVQASYGALAHLVWGPQVRDAWALAPTLWTFTFVFAAVYTTVLHALFGQTIGKMIAGVRVVVGEDGVPPGFGAVDAATAAFAPPRSRSSAVARTATMNGFRMNPPCPGDKSMLRRNPSTTTIAEASVQARTRNTDGVG